MNALHRVRTARRSSALACFAMTFGTACAARVYSESAPGGVYPSTVEDDGIVYVETAPPNIDAYPHYAYGGGDAYYVDGRWYRRGPRGWGYYRQEPPQLARQRPPVVVQAPAPAPLPPVPHERFEAERPPAGPREREQQPPARDVRHDQRQDVERAPAAPRERSHDDHPPAASRPHPGEAEAPPRRDEAPRPDERRPAPQKEHEH